VLQESLIRIGVPRRRRMAPMLDEQVKKGADL
jgi:hypothetical protein